MNYVGDRRVLSDDRVEMFDGSKWIDLGVDWEAIAADQALTIALERTELDKVRDLNTIHQWVALQFAEFVNPANQWEGFSWSWWKRWVDGRAAEAIVLYGLKSDKETVATAISEFSGLLLTNAGLNKEKAE